MKTADSTNMGYIAGKNESVEDQWCFVPGHGSRPPSASLPTPAALKKEPDEPQHRVKMEPHSQSGGEDNNAEMGVDGIKTEIDGLMDSDGEWSLQTLVFQYSGIHDG